MMTGMVPVVYATELQAGSTEDIGSMEVVTAVPVKVAAGGSAHQQGSCCDGCKSLYESSQLFRVAVEGFCQDKKLCMACFVWLSTKGTLDRVGDEPAAPGGVCSTLQKAGEGQGGSSSGCVHADGERGKRQAVLVDTAPEIVIAEGGRNPSATKAFQEASEANLNAIHGMGRIVDDDGSDEALEDDVEIEELLLDDSEEEQAYCRGDGAGGDTLMSTADVDAQSPKIQPCPGPRTPETAKKKVPKGRPKQTGMPKSKKGTSRRSTSFSRRKQLKAAMAARSSRAAARAAVQPATSCARSEGDAASGSGRDEMMARDRPVDEAISAEDDIDHVAGSALSELRHVQLVPCDADRGESAEERMRTRTAEVEENIDEPVNPESDGEELGDNAPSLALDLSTAGVDTRSPKSKFKASSQMELDLAMIRAYKAEWKLPSLDEEIQGLRRGIYKRALAERRAREIAAHCGESEH
jgi:hypothetical protein